MSAAASSLILTQLTNCLIHRLVESLIPVRMINFPQVGHFIILVVSNKWQKASLIVLARAGVWHPWAREMNIIILIKPTESYLKHTFLRPLNDQLNQNFAEKLVVHNLSFLISDWESFSIIKKCCGTRLIVVNFYRFFFKVNVEITVTLLVLFQVEHLLDWSNFSLDYPYIIFCFLKKNEIWSSGFWIMFICSSL